MASITVNCAGTKYASACNGMASFAFCKLGRLVTAMAFTLAFIWVTALPPMIAKDAPQRKLSTGPGSKPSEKIADDEALNVTQGGNVYSLVTGIGPVDHGPDRATSNSAEIAKNNGEELATQIGPWWNQWPSTQSTKASEKSSESVRDADSMHHREDSGKSAAAGSDIHEAGEAKANANANSSTDSSSLHIRPASQSTKAAENIVASVRDKDGMHHREDSGKSAAAGSDIHEAGEAKPNAKANNGTHSSSLHIRSPSQSTKVVENNPESVRDADSMHHREEFGKSAAARPDIHEAGEAKTNAKAKHSTDNSIDHSTTSDLVKQSNVSWSSSQSSKAAENNPGSVREADSMHHSEEFGKSAAARPDIHEAGEAKANAKAKHSTDNSIDHSTTSDLLKQSNVSWQSDRDDAGHEDGNEYQMGAISWIHTVLFFGCCGFCQTLCLAICCGCIKYPTKGRTLPMRIPSLSELLLGFPSGPSGYDLLRDDQQLLDLVTREARLMLFIPLLPLFFMSQTTCEEGTPNLVYALYIPVMIRSKFIEMSILQSRNASPGIFMKAMFFSTLEHLDWFTDGLYPLQARACDEVLTGSFQHSWMPSMAPVVGLVRVWGLAYIVLLAAALCQQALCSLSWQPGELSIALAADAAAFAGLADMIGKGQVERAGKLFPVFSKVLFQNVVLLRLQVFGFALAFSRTSRWAKYKALLSIGLGLSSATYKSIMAIVAWGKWIARESVREERQMEFSKAFAVLCLFSLPSCFALVAVALSTVQLRHAFVCDSHVSNLIYGCVPV